MPLKVDAEFLTAALIGCQAKVKDIEARMSELRDRIGVHPASPAPAGATATKRALSAAARRRMAAAQRKRWAAVRQAQAEGAVKPAVAKAAPKRRRLSPEGRARIVAANRRRWAARKAQAKAAAKSAVRKRATPETAAKAAAKPGLKRAAQTSAARNPKMAVARTKAGLTRPPAKKAQGGKAAAPSMPEASTVTVQSAATE